MGNKISNDNNTILSKYKKIENKNWPKTEVLYQNKENQEEYILEISNCLPNEKLLNDYKYDIDKYRNLNNNKFLKIFYINKKEINNLCSNIFEFKLGIEFYKENLENQILNKIKLIKAKDFNNFKEVIFKEEELIYLLYNLLESSIILKEYYLYHFNLNPKNIIFNENGEIKFLPTMILNKNKNYFDIIQEKNKPIITPESMEKLRQNIFNLDLNKESSIMWNIGIIILSAASLTNYQKFFNYKEYKIDLHQIKIEWIKISKMGYSKLFISLIESMVEEIEEKRAKLNFMFENLKNIIDFN